jgi:hypothetical protein
MSLNITNEFYKIDLNALRYLEIDFPVERQTVPMLLSEIKKDAEQEKSRVWQKLEKLQTNGNQEKIKGAKQYLECIFACLPIPSNVDGFLQHAKDLHQQILAQLDLIEERNEDEQKKPYPDHMYMDCKLNRLMCLIRELLDVLDFAFTEGVVSNLQYLEPKSMKGSKRIICAAQMLRLIRNAQVPNDRHDISSTVVDYLEASTDHLTYAITQLNLIKDQIHDCLDASGYTEFSSSMY